MRMRIVDTIYRRPISEFCLGLTRKKETYRFVSLSITIELKCPSTSQSLFKVEIIRCRVAAVAPLIEKVLVAEPGNVGFKVGVFLPVGFSSGSTPVGVDTSLIYTAARVGIVIVAIGITASAK